MLRKNTLKICVLLLIASALLVISACGYHGNEKVNIPPTIRITSYTGTDAPQDTLAVPFQQTIYWAAEDVDGVVTGYAYRVLNNDGNPISTPGNSVVDFTGTYADEFRSAFAEAGIDPNGWVLHYRRGANESIPLSSEEASRTIWSERVFTIVNFPANDGTLNGNVGNLANVPSRFQVIAIDNRGAISNLEEKFFYTRSRQPELIVTSSRGQFIDNPDNPIGQGIKVMFNMRDGLVGVVPTRPWYFMYRVKRIATTPDSSVVYVSEWKDTKGAARINEVVITGDTDPYLESNFKATPTSPEDLSNPKTVTVIEAKVVDLAGVVSQPVAHKFYVSDRYAPQSMFYPTHTYVLGEHHFTLVQDTNNGDVHPNINTTEGVRFASNFTAHPIFDANGAIETFEWRVVGNEQTRFWFRWGYRGEFEANNPNNKVVGIVRDSTGNTGVNYFSEISYFYIQLNGAPYEFGPLMAIQTPEYNPLYGQYLKVPANHEIAQRISFNGLAPNNPNDPNDFYELKVTVEDLQGKRDPSPAVFRFRVIAPKPVSERSGVLYINNNTADSDIVRNFYDDVIPARHKDNYTYIHRGTMSSRLGAFPRYNIRDGKHLFPASFLQDYKYVIYATDHINTIHNLEKDSDGVRLYMRNGGNVLLVSNFRLKEHHENDLLGAGNRFLINFFGFPTNPASVRRLIDSNVSIQTRRFYFVGADHVSNSALNINAELTNNPDNIMNNWINETRPNDIGQPRMGIPSVTFFDEHNAEVIYTFRSKTTAQDYYSPQTDAERALYHGKPVVIRKANGQGSGYTIGFPLLFMQKNTVQAMLDNVLQ